MFQYTGLNVRDGQQIISIMHFIFIYNAISVTYQTERKSVLSILHHLTNNGFKNKEQDHSLINAVT
jgi:hypothetical protein